MKKFLVITTQDDFTKVYWFARIEEVTYFIDTLKTAMQSCGGRSMHYEAYAINQMIEMGNT